jgi:hypothetical protein
VAIDHHMMNIGQLALAEVNRLGKQLFRWWEPAPSLCQFRYGKPWAKRIPPVLADYMLASGDYYGRLAFYTKRGLDDEGEDERSLIYHERNFRQYEARVRKGGHALFACCAAPDIENVGIFGDMECPVCLDSILGEDDDDPCKTPVHILECGHVLHQACSNALRSRECPLCRHPIDQ